MIGVMVMMVVVAIWVIAVAIWVMVPMVPMVPMMMVVMIGKARYLQGHHLHTCSPLHTHTHTRTRWPIVVALDRTSMCVFAEASRALVDRLGETNGANWEAAMTCTHKLAARE